MWACALSANRCTTRIHPSVRPSSGRRRRHCLQTPMKHTSSTSSAAEKRPRDGGSHAPPGVRGRRLERWCSRLVLSVRGFFGFFFIRVDVETLRNAAWGRIMFGNKCSDTAVTSLTECIARGRPQLRRWRSPRLTARGDGSYATELKHARTLETKGINK